MKKFFTTLTLIFAATGAVAMEKNNTVRLIYPQWQGGYISQWIPEVKNPADSSRGYYLGAELLNFLAPKTEQKILEVPVSTEMTDRKAVDGVIDRDIIL